MPSSTTRFLHVALLVLSFFSSTSGAVPSSHSDIARSIRKATRDTQDISGMVTTRKAQIVANTLNASAIPGWLSTLGADGKWPDSEIDYTTGCNAQRANWPAQVHWKRISTMAAAWAGPLPGATQFQNQDDIKNAISRAMDWWFARDFTNLACLDKGNTKDCPCNTPGLWNTNWFSSIIYVPMPVGSTCLLMSSVLSSTQTANCTHITQRTFNTFQTGITGLGTITGANLLQIAGVGIDGGLFTNNQGTLQDAYSRIHKEVVVQNAVAADGIRPDGSFGQHGGLLYTGNYGKDYINAVLQVEIPAAGTSFQAEDASISAFDTLMDGCQWMIYTNSITGVEHWDFSTLSRMISFPVADQQATGSLNIPISQFQALGKTRNDGQLQDVFNQLNQNSTSANTGSLTGNRAFWNNDYMVHRGADYVTTIKGYSSRTLNSECTNDENKLGFHLSDGAVFIYQRGDEYEDVAAAWDWNLIPGITVDYGATPLNCDSTKAPKSSQSFVGGASNGDIGAFAMQYTNPNTKNLSWKKSWFMFQGDVQHVIISDLSSKSSSNVFSVLDQKKHNGAVLMDGKDASNGNFTDFTTLWHSNVGYFFDKSALGGAVELSIDVQQRSGPWSALGVSTQPPANVDMFAAWLHHKDLSKPVSYTAFMGMDQDTFSKAAQPGRISVLANSSDVHAAMDTVTKDVMINFFTANTPVTIPNLGQCTLTITTDHPAAVILSPKQWNVTVSDPAQSSSSITLSVSGADGYSAKFPFTLPSGGLAGTSVSQDLSSSLGAKCPVSNIGVPDSSKGSDAIASLSLSLLSPRMIIVFVSAMMLLLS